MKVYKNFTEGELAIAPETDKIIDSGAGAVNGDWSSAHVSGIIAGITINIGGVSTDKASDLSGIEFTGLVTAGLGNSITSIELTSGFAILYK